MFDAFQQNLCSPLPLAFALGVAAKLLKSELSLPKDVYSAISIYLLLALGLKGGVELSHTPLSQIAWPAAATLLIGCITPLTSYSVLRWLGGFSVPDAAGIAAHYGSVSAVTFIAAQQFAEKAGFPVEGFMPTLLTLLESPGIHVALAIGAVQMARESQNQLLTDASGEVKESKSLRKLLHEVFTARSMILLVGGLLCGFVMQEPGYAQVKPFFQDMFKGVLTIFLLELGMVTGSRLGDLTLAGPFLLVFGIVMPIAHGAMAAALGHAAHLSVGGCAVLAAMAASASYIAAPPAVRLVLPQANPAYYLTAALAITFPFNLLFGIPLYLRIAQWLAGASSIPL